MKREGRQHGMVRAYGILPSPWNPKPNSKIVNRFDSRPTAGLFTRVPSKPSNHSKYTGKCGRPRCNGCHCHPVCKSKDKAKGTQKLKSVDVAMNHRLISWKVVNSSGRGFNCGGISATAILGHLNNDYDHDYDYDYDYEEEGEGEEGGDRVNQIDRIDDRDLNGDDQLMMMMMMPSEDVIEDYGVGIVEIDRQVEEQREEEQQEEEEECDDDEEFDDGMSFCDVGFVIDQADGDEGWCLVEEL